MKRRDKVVILQGFSIFFHNYKVYKYIYLYYNYMDGLASSPLQARPANLYLMRYLMIFHEKMKIFLEKLIL